MRAREPRTSLKCRFFLGFRKAKTKKSRASFNSLAVHVATGIAGGGGGPRPAPGRVWRRRSRRRGGGRGRSRSPGPDPNSRRLVQLYFRVFGFFRFWAGAVSAVASEIGPTPGRGPLQKKGVSFPLEAVLRVQSGCALGTGGENGGDTENSASFRGGPGSSRPTEGGGGAPEVRILEEKKQKKKTIAAAAKAKAPALEPIIFICNWMIYLKLLLKASRFMDARKERGDRPNVGDYNKSNY